MDLDRGYPDWLETHRRLRRLRHAPFAVAGAAPWLSVAIALERPSPSRLAAAIASVADQTTPSVELVVALREPVAPGVADLLRRGEAGGRLRTVAVPSGAPPTEPLERALAACRGVWVGVMGEHDRLEPDLVAELHAADTGADVLLSDEDAIDPDGALRDPAFNGAWDPDVAVAQPPRGFLAVRRDLLQRLGGLGAYAQGEEEWDLLLRASAATRPSLIRTVPAVLRHRGARPDGGGGGWSGVQVVQEHLRRTGQAGCTVERAGERLVRVRRPIPAPAPLVSIVIPTRDRADLLRACLEGLLRRTSYPSIEVLVVDNDSREPEALALLEEVARDPRVRVIASPGPFNWSALNNAAVAAMRGEVAVLLNNDTEVVEPDWLEELVSQAVRPEVGAVGARLLYPDGSVQHAGILLGSHGRGIHMWRHFGPDEPGHRNQLRAVRQVAAVTGACVALRREVFEAVRGLEAEALQVTWNDVDLCLRVRAAGWRVLWTPYAVLTHVELATRGKDDAPEARARVLHEHAYMRRTWGPMLRADPFFSSSLDPREGTPELAPQVFDPGEAPAGL